MNTDSILKVLQQERANLLQQIAALDKASEALRGGKRKGRQRSLSAAARARIAAAQRKRWAAWHKERK